MMRVETIAILEDKSMLVLTCGHTVSTTAPNVAIGQPWACPSCERRKDLVLPKPEDVLDAIAAEYVATMQAQGFVIGEPEEAAIRRAANIQYTWYCAMRAVLG